MALVRILLVAGLLVVLGACASEDRAVPAPSPGPASSPSAGPSQRDPSEGGAPGRGSTGRGDDETCAQVRAGIEAFNQGDYDETVARFEEAVPLADAAQDDSASASLLAQAVHYYADLAPADYAEASRSSDDFEKYKQITLSLCADGLEPPSDPGVPA